MWPRPHGFYRYRSTRSATPPKSCRNLGRGLAATEWTGSSSPRGTVKTLEPILDDYGQYTIREYDESGEYTGDFAHMLRVFLIDRELRVRNIYSVAFLHADILINDLETLLLESPSS